MNQPDRSEHPKSQTETSKGGPGSKPRTALEASDGKGITFLFKYDDLNKGIVEIFCENKVSAEEAIDTFFSGSSSWNPELSRFETYTDAHGLFWYWLHKGQAVIVITCFRVQGKGTNEKKRIWMKDLADYPVDADVDYEVRRQIRQVQKSGTFQVDSDSYMTEDVQDFMDELMGD
jgi:hypothetical protein